VPGTNAQELLSELRRRGVRLRLRDGRLDVVAPRGVLTAPLRERLAREREELVALLGRAVAAGERTRIVPDPAARHEPFPLTDIQHAYLVGRSPAVQLGGVSTHFYVEMESTGLDPVRLGESLRRVIERHDMLRAVVLPDGRQRVLPEVPPYEIATRDLRGLPPTRVRAEIGRWRAELGHQVLPAERWPLFDIRASLLDGDRLRLHVSFDLLIVDAMGIGMVTEEWRRCYEDPKWRPEPLELSFRDHVLAAQTLRDGERYRAARAYWLGRLDTLPPAPALPLARRPEQLERTEFERRRGRLARPLWDTVKARARKYGVTPSAVLVTAFADVLRLWSRQSELTLNLTLFDRPPGHPQIDAVLGDFTSVTLLAVGARPDVPFAERVRRTGAQLARDLEHASFSGVRVLRERARRLGGRPGAAMPVVFTSLLGGPGTDRSFPGEVVYGISQTPQVWLDHQVAEEQGELVYDWDAVAALFPDGLLDDLFATYARVLERLGREEAAWRVPGPPAGLPAWQAAERSRANDSCSPVPARTLCGLVAERAERCPGAPAVICAGRETTYGGLLSGARQLARRLRALGAAPGTLVGVVLDKGVDQVTAVLGVTLAGAAYLPVDPEWPLARRAELLAQGGVGIVVTSGRLRADASWPAGLSLVAPDDPETAAEADGPLDGGPGPDDLAYVIFTSGSTGRPKGVAIDHRGAANTVQDINTRFGVGPSDRVLALSALSFDLSVYDVFGVLAAGGTVVVPSPERQHDPAHWGDLVRRHSVTVWNSVPALMQAWLQTRPPKESSLRLVLLSGDWIPVTQPAAIRALAPGVRLVSLGGATEASIWSVCYPIGDVPPEWTRIPYGKPLANQTLHVYDDALEPCPVWSVGEIFIGGVGVARGYWADPERTAERFVVRPATGERLYRTGDLGRYLPGGDIEFLGRGDHQVKLNGYRIEPGEIEAALRRQPGVAEAVVRVHTSERTGSRQLAAYAVAERADADVPAAADGRWPALVAAGADELRRAAAESAAEWRTHRRLRRALDRVAPLVMARALARLGVFTRPGERADVDEVVERGGVKPEYRGLVRQWLAVLAGGGLLRAEARDGVFHTVAGFDVGALDAEVRAGLAALDAEGAHGALLEYATRCADDHPGLLRGEVSPLEVLLPDGDWRVLDALYADNPDSAVQNRVAARIARTLAGQVPAPRPVRVVEIGAGTGATTARILSALPPERAEYRFTDISTFFTHRARQRFADHPFVSYDTLDVDLPLEPQGFEPGSADLVVAANVLHDAGDLAASLRELRHLLAPGGVLLLVEGMVTSSLQLMTFGFLEGLAAAGGRRESPFLSAEEWQRALESAGFTHCAAVPGPEAVTELEQRVLLARAPDGPVRPSAAGLRRALAGLLPSYMVPRHCVIVDRLPLGPNGKVDASALPAPWDEMPAVERIAPRDDTERLLFGLWCEVLGREDFGVRDDFFELGGDSLHAVHMLGRLPGGEERSGSPEDTLRLLFDNPTVEGWAAALRTSASARPAGGRGSRA